MPALTEFTFGALNPLTVDQFTERELSEYLTAYRRAQTEGGSDVQTDRR